MKVGAGAHLVAKGRATVEILEADLGVANRDHVRRANDVSR
jgi:hypothetical protein